MRPAARALEPQITRPAVARAVGVPGNRRRRPAKVAAVESWAHARVQAGARLDPREAAGEGLVPVALLAAQILARWLARQRRRQGLGLDAAVLVEAGVLDYVPDDVRLAQARWLVGLVDVDEDAAAAPGGGDRDPRPLGVGDFVSALEVRTGAHGGGKAVRARPSRARERSPRVVAAAIPDGGMRAPHRTAFMDAVAAAPELAHRRGDFVANVLRVAWELALGTDWADTRCTTPTWARLTTRTGLSRSTVARALTALQIAGLLGVVATGQAGYTTTTKADEGRNLAAVYVLCTARPRLVVDVTDTPPTEGLEREPVHAGAREQTTRPAPLRGLPNPATPSGPSQEPVPHDIVRLTTPGSSPTDGQDEPAAQAVVPVKGRHLTISPGSRPPEADDEPERTPHTERDALARRFAELLDAGWQVRDLPEGLNAPAGTIPPRPTSEGPATDDPRWTRGARAAARLAVADLLRRNAPPLRGMRVSDIAVVIAPFVAAGYSAPDLHHALDAHPDGEPHHAGPPSTRDGATDRTPWRMRGWLTWRLAHWRGPDGDPLRSRTQRAAADHHQAIARMRARATERANDPSLRIDEASPISAEVRAAFRADADRLRRQREHERD